MTLRHTRTFLFACILFAGCDRPPGESPPVALKGTVVSDGEFLGQPGRLLLVGDRLMVTDDPAPYLHVLDPKEGRHLASIGNSGGGPGEFRSVSSIQEDPSEDGSFWLYDGQQDRMTHMGLVAGTVTPRMLEVSRLDSVSGLLLDLVVLDETTLVATNLFSNGRLVRARRSGATIGVMGAMPVDPLGRDVPLHVLQHAYAGPLERSPDGSRVAVATRQADLLEIYRADGTLIRRVRGGSGFEPEYEVRRSPAGTGMATGEDLRFGFIDLAATDEHLFALFSGELRGDLPGRANFGKAVQVYDWRGERVATFELPERALSIAVSPDGAQLFAVHHDPKPAIVRYLLREHLPGS
jgi:hypothetical protein